MPDILHLVKIQAPAERAYKALTSADGIRNWWTRDAGLDPRIGGVGEFRFYDGKSTTRIEVVELHPQARVSWRTPVTRPSISRGIFARARTLFRR